MSTISSTITTGVTLGVTYSSPLTITTSGAIEAGAGAGVYAAATYANPTLVNYGTINGNADGVDFRVGGYVDNAGFIQGGNAGVEAFFGAVTLANSGTIGGSGAGGVQLFAGGGVDNQTGGLIEGAHDGVYIGGALGMVTNAGTIVGSGGAGFAGVRLEAGGTVVDSGAITGSGGTAVYFGGGGGNLLVLDPGYSLTGGVVGSTQTGATNRLELGSAASAGTVSAALQSEFQNFGTITVDAGAQWTLSGTSTLAGVTLSDFGTLNNTGSLSGAVTLAGGGYLDNQARGRITGSGGAYTSHAPGGAGGAAVVLSAGAIANSGTIAGGAGGPGFSNFLTRGYDGGAGGSGILLSASGAITNSGLIVGGAGGAGGIYGGAGGAGGAGIVLSAFGTVANSGTIAGGAGGAGGRAPQGFYGANGADGSGILLDAGGTVVDSGTISGASGTAIYFGGGGGNLLALEAGYKLTGVVVGSTALGANNTLELAGTLGNPLTVNYNGLALTNFQDVLFGSGGNDTLEVSNTGGTLPVTVSGFISNSETIDLTQIGTDGSITSQSATQVTVAGSLGSETLQLDASDGTAFTVQTDGASGTDLVACFCRGTRILTPRGEVAVERLKIGGKVTNFAGRARKVRWIGKRAYAGRFVAGNKSVLPIRIAAGALAEGVPARDLYLSPEHSLYLDGVLAQAKHLVNGMTITQAEEVESIEYFHIELESHDVIIADGAPAETYVDCDNRTMFQNAGEYARRYPEEDGRPTWEFCAERLEWGVGALTGIRAALLRRAAALGHELDPDPDLHLLIDGEIIRPDAAGSDKYRFTIPAGSADVRLASRTAVPAESLAEGSDRRRLGVPLQRIVLSDADLSTEVWHGHKGFGDGFHQDEETHRWTAGLARLPEALLRPFPGEFALEVHLAPSDLGYRGPAFAAAADARPAVRRGF